MKMLIEKIKPLLTAPDTFDPDDLRRRQVLSSILLFVFCVTLLQFVADFWNDKFIDIILTRSYTDKLDTFIHNRSYGDELDMFVVFVVLVSGLVFFPLLFVLNRSSRVPKNLTGWVFIIGFLVLILISDTPEALIRGRSIFVWAIPIALSVVILPPASVLVVDVIITMAFSYYAGFDWHYLETYTLTEIYIVSFISWMGMSIANKAIRDARNEAGKNAAILNDVAEGVLVLGPKNQIVLANRAASELMGSEMTGILPTTESASVAGRTLSLHWSEVKGLGWVAIVRDISRQIEIDRAKDAILRVVSHEMRTPLAAILGFAEILESRPVPGLAARIRANAQRMLKLVNDLLDVAQLQAGALPVRSETFSPSILVSYVCENYLKPAEEKGIRLEVHLSPTLPEQVTGDVQRLEQVISNLVENALKFTEKEGRVNISFCMEDGIDWQIVVRDTGIGIPPECLPDIFEPFRRASDYAKRKYQGIGLGLSIVKRIVQLSGGRISVESVVGEGSTFTVTLPIHRSA